MTSHFEVFQNTDFAGINYFMGMNNEVVRILSGRAWGSPTDEETLTVAEFITNFLGIADLTRIGFGFYTLVFSSDSKAYAATCAPEGFLNGSNAASRLFPDFCSPAILSCVKTNGVWVIEMELIDGVRLDAPEITGMRLEGLLCAFGMLLVNGGENVPTGSKWGVDQSCSSVLEMFASDTEWSCECPRLICERLENVTEPIRGAVSILTDYDYRFANSIPSWVHGDSHLANVMAEHDGRLRVYDWSQLSVQPKLLEFVSLERQTRWYGHPDKRLMRHAERAAETMRLVYPTLREQYGQQMRGLLGIGCLANGLSSIMLATHNDSNTMPDSEHYFNLTYSAYLRGLLPSELASGLRYW